QQAPGTENDEVSPREPGAWAHEVPKVRIVRCTASRGDTPENPAVGTQDSHLAIGALDHDPPVVDRGRLAGVGSARDQCLAAPRQAPQASLSGWAELRKEVGGEGKESSLARDPSGHPVRREP